jgi:hypothetical protein
MLNAADKANYRLHVDAQLYAFPVRYTETSQACEV